MRLLHLADLHLGKLLAGRARYDEQEQVLEEIAAVAEREQIDLVVIAGDVFDTYNPPAQAQQLFFAFLERLAAGGARPVVAIAGNHDQPLRLAAASPLALAQNIYLLGEPEQELAVPEQNTTFVSYEDNCLNLRLPGGEAVSVLALPYISEARLGELYRQELGDEQSEQADYEQCLARLLARGSAQFADGAKVVLAHLSLVGGQPSQSERTLAVNLEQPVNVGGSFGVSTRIFPANADYLALGHLHRPQEIGGAYYAGSPLAYSFSEAGQVKRVLVAELQDGGCVVRSLPLSSGYPLCRHLAAGYQEALAWCEEPLHHDLWVELTVEMSVPLEPEQISALRHAHPRLLDIILRFPQSAADPAERAVAEDLPIAERFRRFAASREGVEPEPELLALFAELLEQGEGEQA